MNSDIILLVNVITFAGRADANQYSSGANTQLHVTNSTRVMHRQDEKTLPGKGGNWEGKPATSSLRLSEREFL